MSRNAEIKAHLPDRRATETAVAAMATQGPVLLEQEDTFFDVPTGRLKLRTESASPPELIFYRRPDERGPRVSEYMRVPVPDAAALTALLRTALRVRGHVRKLRTLYLIGRTRVHLDQVDGLGDFLELEVVLQEGESIDIGIREANDLLHRLGVRDADLEPRAYLDLLRQ